MRSRGTSFVIFWSYALSITVFAKLLAYIITETSSEVFIASFMSCLSDVERYDAEIVLPICHLIAQASCGVSVMNDIMMNTDFSP